MIRRTFCALFGAAIVWSILGTQLQAQQQAYGRQWGHSYKTQDWNRMYHYPYVYYPQNYWGRDYYRSSDNMYHRYPAEMRVPVYHKQWQNMYPEHRKDPPWKQHQFNPMFGSKSERHSGSRYTQGHHFIADVF